MPHKNSHDIGTQAGTSQDEPPEDTSRDLCRWDVEAQPARPGYATWDPDVTTGIGRHSPAWSAITGMGAAAMEEQRLNWSWWTGRMDVDDMAVVGAIQQAFYAERWETAEVTFRFQRPDGRWVRLLSRGSVTRRGKGGTPELVSGMVVDVSRLANMAVGQNNEWAGQAVPSPEDLYFPPRIVKAPGHGPGSRDIINERRLNSLYMLSQMEFTSEVRLAQFTLSSIVQLTDSASAFLFIPDKEIAGTGHMYWSGDLVSGLRKELLPEDRLPPEFYPLIMDASGEPLGNVMCNGDGKTPLFFSPYGGGFPYCATSFARLLKTAAWFV